LRKADERAVSLIQLYRRENLSARTSPPPAYFSEPAPISPEPEDALSLCGREISDAEGRLAAGQTTASDVLRTLAADMESISARLDGRTDP
jgi:hypothetical protein